MLLAASGVAKLADMSGFVEVVKSYDGLPLAVTPIAAYALTLFELALAAWLATGKNARRAAEAAMALHAVYLLWSLIALARGLNIANCGCFGVYWARPLTWFTPLEDLILIALAIFLWRGVRKFTPTP